VSGRPPERDNRAVPSRVRATTVVPGRIVEAEELWYDRHRWAAWVDGFGHVLRLDGDWPQVGARKVWASPPKGRGQVQEVVTAYEPRVRHSVMVEDERLSGTQTVTFEAAGADEVRVTLMLEYELKGANFFTPLADAVFIRRELTESLRRTLARFGHERRAEL
jgi:Polyketide cyclase / dehydrase and lipid transport